MFVSLGLVNAWHNKGRTLLGMVSMAVAAIIFASSATLSQGFPSTAYFEARQLLGADILLFPGKTVVSRDELASANWTWRFQKASLDTPNSSFGFDVNPYYRGNIRGEFQAGPVPDAKQMREAVFRLQDNPAVLSAAVRRALPFLFGYRDHSNLEFAYGFLEPRDVSADCEIWRMEAALLGSGRYLEPKDSGQLVGVVCNGWHKIGLPEDKILMLEIPRAFFGDDGRSYRDFENSLKVPLQILGAVSFQEAGLPPAVQHANPSVFVTSETFNSLSRDAGYCEDDTVWGIGVTVNDMSTLDNVASLLRREFVDFTVITSPALAAASADKTGFPGGVPLDMRRVTEALAFLTAALLAATNLTVLMLQRRTEIGILRSIGATPWNIVCMVMTESIWVAVVGSTAGSILTQPALFWNLLSNKLGWDVVFQKAASTAGRSLGFAVASALIFGFLPVTKALKVSPAQILRGD